MGHAIVNGLDLMGTARSIHLDPEFKKGIDNMVSMANKQNVTKREKMHVEAVRLFANG